LQLVQSIQENGVWSQRLGLVRVQGQTAEYEPMLLLNRFSVDLIVLGLHVYPPR
jgi:hypothetical protein